MRTYIFAFDLISGACWIEGRYVKVVSLNNYVPAGTEPRLEFKRDGKMMVLHGSDGFRLRNPRVGMAELRSQSAGG